MYFDLAYGNLKDEIGYDDTILNNITWFGMIADYYADIGVYERSIPLYEKMLAVIKRKQRVTQPWDEDYTTRRIASNYEGWGKYSEAEARYKESIARTPKDDNLKFFERSLDLTDFYFRRGQNALVRPIYEQVIKQYDASVEQVIKEYDTSPDWDFLKILENENRNIYGFAYYVRALHTLGKLDEKENSSVAKSRYERAAKVLDVHKKNCGLAIFLA